MQPEFGSNFSSEALKMLKIFSSLDLIFIYLLKQKLSAPPCGTGMMNSFKATKIRPN